MTAVTDGLELERRVLDVEMADQTRLQLVEQLRRMPVKEAAFVQYHVSRERRQVRRDGPDVQVMHVQHVIGGKQVLPDVGEVESLGRRFEEHPAGVAQQPPRSLDHEADDDQ
jgi:hypothetical protein